MSAPEAVEHYVAEEQRRAQAEVLGLLSACGAEHAQLRLEPLQGSPSASILSCANEERADLVVLGTNQRRGLQRLLLGSVAQQVLLDAEQDVLVVPIEAS
jgi:nucleotide-binding universal stress UspA family protein